MNSFLIPQGADSTLVKTDLEGNVLQYMLNTVLSTNYYQSFITVICYSKAYKIGMGMLRLKCLRLEITAAIEYLYKTRFCRLI